MTKPSPKARELIDLLIATVIDHKERRAQRVDLDVAQKRLEDYIGGIEGGNEMILGYLVAEEVDQHRHRFTVDTAPSFPEQNPEPVLLVRERGHES